MAKILDFGLVKFLVSPADSLSATVGTVTGVLVGTPQYMSPDQLNGEAASAEWDTWALAVIAYEMLTGTHPFPATSVGQMHFSIVSGRFTPLTTHLPDAPASSQQFFERALSSKTAERPRSAQEFIFQFTKGICLQEYDLRPGCGVVLRLMPGTRFPVDSPRPPLRLDIVHIR